MSAIGDFFGDHSSGIMTALSIAGLATTVALAIKATPEAYETIMQAREDLERVRTDEEASRIKKQALKHCAKAYAPAAIALAATVSAEIIDLHMETSDKAELAAAAAIPAGYLLRYQDEVRHTIGDKKEFEIRQRVAEKELELERYKSAPTYIVGEGDYLMYDSHNGVKFMGNKTLFDEAINKANANMLANDEVTVGDLYSYLDVYDVPKGSVDKKWKVGHGLIDVYYTYDGRNEDGRPMMVINYRTEPKGR